MLLRLASLLAAEMIDRRGNEIQEIIVSLESRHVCHISHAVSWHAAGQPDVHPVTFTRIMNADVLSGRWVHADKSADMQRWALSYTEALERRGMVLTMWPEHCIIGTKGHSVTSVIHKALQRWERTVDHPVRYVMKGQNSTFIR